MFRVIVADDDEQVRLMLRMTLEQAGYEVMGAADGNFASEMQREQPADVLITDIIMPDCEGLETIRQFRREFPEVRIIAISGGGKVQPDDYLRMAGRFGADRVFTKPVDRAALLGAVADLLDAPPAGPANANE